MLNYKTCLISETLEHNQIEPFLSKLAWNIIVHITCKWKLCKVCVKKYIYSDGKTNYSY